MKSSSSIDIMYCSYCGIACVVIISSKSINIFTAFIIGIAIAGIVFGSKSSSSVRIIAVCVVEVVLVNSSFFLVNICYYYYQQQQQQQQ